MAIDLAPGEIYFIGEVDVRSKEPSSYVKIGLVRERDDKRVDERVLEHQTGNPRQLTLLRSIKTPCVSKVENHLHRSFATSQVSGEWFHLDAQGLDESMALCEQLAEDAGRRSAFAEAAKSFGPIEQEPAWDRVLSYPSAKLHLYGKASPKQGRKMGHINCLGETAVEAIKTCAAVAADLGIEP